MSYDKLTYNNEDFVSIKGKRLLLSKISNGHSSFCDGTCNTRSTNLTQKHMFSTQFHHPRQQQLDDAALSSNTIKKKQKQTAAQYQEQQTSITWCGIFFLPSDLPSILTSRICIRPSLCDFHRMVCNRKGPRPSWNLLAPWGLYAQSKEKSFIPHFQFQFCWECGTTTSKSYESY